MNNQKLWLVLLCLTTILLTISPSAATYDVVSGIASNSTTYTTSASYQELHNISLATGTGITFIKASWEASMNFTAPLYGRFMRDGESLGRFNLTQSVYAQVGSYEIAFNETTGTHQYGWEVYSNRRGWIYSRNFSAVFLKNGTYGSGAGGAGNVSSVTGEPAGVLDCTGTDDVTCTVTAPTAWTTTYNSSYVKGGGSFSIENGTNVIAAGYSNNFTTVYAGSFVKFIAHSAETGSINVSFYNGTTYIDSVVISSGTDGSKTLNYAFGDESLIRYEVTSVTDITKVTITIKTLKS
jgi:hypothetical protein